RESNAELWARPDQDVITESLRPPGQLGEEAAMHMNVKPIPALDPRINEIRALTAQIVNREILPNERKLWAGWRDGATEEDRRGGRGLRGGVKGKGEGVGV